MKCKTCGFNNELHSLPFCGLKCAMKLIDQQAEQIESLLQSGTVLANARLELLAEIQQLKEKPITWLCENCESKKADIRHLKDLLKSCFVEMVALQWEFRDGSQGNIYKRVKQALAAPPQKGE